MSRRRSRSGVAGMPGVGPEPGGACYGLEGVPSRKPHIVEALRGRPHAVPEGRWAAIFAAAASSILDLLLVPARLARGLARWTEAMLLHEAVDPNLSRQSLLARVENAATS